MAELALTLPSGRAARLSDTTPDAPPVADDFVDGKRMFGGRMLSALASGRLALQIDGADASPAQIDALPLPDYHALRDAAYRIGAVADEPEPDLTCRNCDAPLAPGPADAPLAELDRWYVEDAEPPLRGPFPLGATLRLPNGGRARTFDMVEVTVGEAKPLWRALEREDVRVTPRLVGSLGLRALGDVTDRRAIARALEHADDDVWAVLETAFVLLAYAPRSTFPFVCPKCGALHDVLAPGTREFDLDPDAEAIFFGEAPSPEPAQPFPDEDAFAETALRIGREVYRDKGVAHVELVVDTDVPEVDGSGEPLMGSYRPIARGDAAGYTDLRFEIEIYYRTFEKMYAEAPFDVEAELRETIEHEVDHHLAYLAGRDLTDEHERDEALAELERTYGKRAVQRARLTSTLADLRLFGWFLLAALVAVAAIAFFVLGE